jgi:excisionase family DNA binding protein
MGEKEPVAGRLLLGREVAAILRVDPRTVTRWAKEEKIRSCRTPGGQRRYYESEIRDLAKRQVTRAA